MFQNMAYRPIVLRIELGLHRYWQNNLEILACASTVSKSLGIRMEHMGLTLSLLVSLDHLVFTFLLMLD